MQQRSCDANFIMTAQANPLQCLLFFGDILKPYNKRRGKQWCLVWAAAFGLVVPGPLPFIELFSHIKEWCGQVTVPVCVFAFDLLYVDGLSVLGASLRERRQRLAAALPGLRAGYVALARSWELPSAATRDVGIQSPMPGVAMALEPGLEGSKQVGDEAGAGALDDPCRTGQASEVDHDDGCGANGIPSRQQDDRVDGPESVRLKDASKEEEASDPREVRLREILQDAFAAGTEGIMLKALDIGAGYQPSKRSEAWLKIKKCAKPLCIC